MRGRFSNPWWVVVGAVVGLFVCNGPILGYTFGIFLKPLMVDMGWNRGTASFAMAFGEVFAALTVPVYGWMMDRWTIRRVALPGIVVFAVFLCLLGLTPKSLAIFTVLFAFTAVAGAIQTPLGYVKAISAWFDRRRGIALGIALAGVGFGALVVPQLANLFIARFGWRGAFVILGVMVAAIALPAVALWIREPLPGEGEWHGRPPARDLPGLTVGQAAATRQFWLLAATFFLVALGLLGSSGHIVPLLTDRGLTPAQATATFSLIGLSTLCGRLVAGWLMDRVHAAHVATVFFLAPIAGFAFLLGGSGLLPAVGVVLVGLGLGAEVDMIAFLITRYLGQRSFGMLYGYFFMAFGLGGSCGRMLGGYLFDRAGSYRPAVIGASIGLVAAVILINCLGRYVYPVQRPFAPELAPLPARP
jgi:MFS family permease